MIYKNLLTLCFSLFLFGATQSFAQVKKTSDSEAKLDQALSDNTCWSMYKDNGAAISSYASISPTKSTTRVSGTDYLALTIKGKSWTIQSLEAKRIVIKKESGSPKILIPCK